MVDKSRMAMSTSTNPRWPAQTPLQALKVLHLSLCVLWCRSKDLVLKQGKEYRNPH